MYNTKFIIICNNGVIRIPNNMYIKTFVCFVQIW